MHSWEEEVLILLFKAALINVFIRAMDQMTMCHVKREVLQFPSALQNLLASLSSMFWFYRVDHTHQQCLLLQFV